MNKEMLKGMIDNWEIPNAEIVRTIDSEEGTVERIVKYGDGYYLYRYFEIGGIKNGTYVFKVMVSVDLVDVNADRIICELAERL